MSFKGTKGVRETDRLRELSQSKHTQVGQLDATWNPELEPGTKRDANPKTNKIRKNSTVVLITLHSCLISWFLIFKKHKMIM